jgi:hypothetical protein
VQLRVPGVPGEKLAAAASLLQRHYGRWFREPADAHFHRDIFPVGRDYVQMPGFVAVEFLHKCLRFLTPRNLRHEMQECLVSLDPLTLRDQLATVFGGVQHVSLEPTVSGGFRQAYLDFGIQARRAARVTEELSVPLAFASLRAFATERQKRRPSPRPPEQPPGFGVRQSSLCITHNFFMSLGNFCLVPQRLMQFMEGCLNPMHPPNRRPIRPTPTGRMTNSLTPCCPINASCNA